MKKIAVLACVGLLAAGCASEKPAIAERHTAWQPQSAVPSAAPSMPAQTSAPARIASSGTGKLAAAQAGKYMDAQENELRQRLRGSGVNVRRLGDDILLSIGNDILFDTGSADLSPRAGGVMAAMADVLMRYNKTAVEVGGYSDTTGLADFNLKLSQARARAVAGKLMERGVDRSRVTSQGYGETHLKVPTGDQVNQPRNRRVEIKIIPHTEG